MEQAATTSSTYCFISWVDLGLFLHGDWNALVCDGL